MSKSHHFVFVGIAKEKLSQVFDTFVQEKEGHNRMYALELMLLA